MAHKKNRKIYFIILTVFLLTFSSIPVWAANTSLTIDWTKQGSIEVLLHANDSDIVFSNEELILYKVADISEKDNNISYTYTDTFKNCGFSLEDLQDKVLPERIEKYAKEKNIVGTVKKTDAQGKTVFDKLSLGLYLITQKTEAKDFSYCKPFLVSIPLSEEEGWQYDIKASPKSDDVQYMDFTVKKVWNDSGKDRPDSVSVELCKNGITVKTIVLNESNNWSHTWKHLEKSDEWTAKEINVPKGYKVTYKNNEQSVIITNTASLAQTGQLNWPIPVLTIVGLLLFAIGWTLVFIKGRNRNV